VNSDMCPPVRVSGCIGKYDFGGKGEAMIGWHHTRPGPPISFVVKGQDYKVTDYDSTTGKVTIQDSKGTRQR